MRSSTLESFDHGRFRHLIDVHCEESLSPEQRNELQQILLESAAARELFIELMSVHTGLSQEIDILAQIEGIAEGAPQKVQLGSRSDLRRLTISLAALIAIAASLILAAVVWPPQNGGTQVGSSREPVEFSPEPDSPYSQDALARVVRKINCVWSDEAWTLNNSSEIEAGRTIALERGFMSLAFRNGVNVILEGPIEFTVIDENRGALEFGGLGVRVPEGSSGFVVDTPTAKVTDLGTAFSLRVSDEGVTDLSVIEGEVEVSRRGQNGNVDSEGTLVLEKDTEWSSSLGIRVPQDTPSSADFPISGLLDDPVFGRVPELPVSDKLLLWLMADAAVNTDSQGRVVAWGDASSRVSNERHSAWQVEPRRRPRLLREQINGLPAIRFDGQDDCLITEPFPTGDAQTVAIVGRLYSLDRHKGELRGPQFINYNGPPNLVVEYDSLTSSIRGRVFAGFGREPSVSGQARIDAIHQDETLAIVYTYDHHANEAILYLNAERRTESEALVSSASARPKVIGIHSRLKKSGLTGDIAEVLIFDRALDSKEVDSLFSYFQSRYDTLGTSTEASTD